MNPTAGDGTPKNRSLGGATSRRSNVPLPANSWDHVLFRGSLSEYLTSTPYCINGSWGGKLTEELFRANFYIDSFKADTCAEMLSQAHSSNRILGRRFFTVSGDRGTGKTTFINHAFRLKEEGAVNTQQPWTSDQSVYLVDFEDTATVALAKRMTDFDHQTVSPIAIHALKVFVANTLLADHGSGPRPIQVLFRDFYPNTDIRDRILANISDSGRLHDFFSTLKEEVETNDSLGRLPDRAKLLRVMAGMEEHDLIYLLGFSVIADMLSREVMPRGVYLVFDNIDCISAEMLAKSVFAEFTGLWTHFPRYLEGYDTRDVVAGALGEIVAVVGVRVTTRDILESTRTEWLKYHDGEVKLAEVYDVSEILKLRLDLYAEAARDRARKAAVAEARELTKLAEGVIALRKFITDTVAARQLMMLFNGNIRLVGFTLAEALKEYQFEIIESANILLKVSEEPESAGRRLPTDRLSLARGNLARGALWRAVLHAIYKEDYFNKDRTLLHMSSAGTGSRGGSTSVPLPLLVLTYLKNVKEGRAGAKIDPNQGVPLVTLYRRFNGLYDTILTDLAQTLWQLYWRETDYTWCRFVRIPGLDVEGDKTLFTAAQTFPSVSNRLSRSSVVAVRITDAGLMFIDHLQRHFEFFSILGNDGEGRALVSLAQADDLEGVLDSIRRAREMLQKLGGELTDVVDRLFVGNGFVKSPEAFLDSVYSYSTPAAGGRDITQHYYERAVFTVLGYIDDLRYWWSASKPTSAHLKAINPPLAVAMLELLDLLKTPDGGGPIHARNAVLSDVEFEKRVIECIRDFPLTAWTAEPMNVPSDPARRSLVMVELGVTGTVESAT